MKDSLLMYFGEFKFYNSHFEYIELEEVKFSIHYKELNSLELVLPHKLLLKFKFKSVSNDAFLRFNLLNKKNKHFTNPNYELSDYNKVIDKINYEADCYEKSKVKSLKNNLKNATIAS